MNGAGGLPLNGDSPLMPKNHVDPGPDDDDDTFFKGISLNPERRREINGRRQQQRKRGNSNSSHNTATTVAAAATATAWSWSQTVHSDNNKGAPLSKSRPGRKKIQPLFFIPDPPGVIKVRVKGGRFNSLQNDLPSPVCTVHVVRAQQFLCKSLHLCREIN